MLPEAIDLMVRGLKSGLPVTEVDGRGRPRDDGASRAPSFAHITDCVRFGAAAG